MVGSSVPDTNALRRGPLPPVITPALRRLLGVVLGLFGLLAVNSLYLVSVTLAERLSGATYQNYFYLSLFLVHLVLGLLLVVPAVAFGALHLRRAWPRPNRYAVRAGLGLYLSGLLLLISGVLLTRFGFFEVNDPLVRRIAYWVHLLTPLLVVWLFVLHRLAGARVRWRAGVVWGAFAAGFSAVALGAHLLAPEPKLDLKAGFAPALSQTPGGGTIPAEQLMTDETCAECHPDIARQHEKGMHRLSSFNNPAYRFSVEETRRVVLDRDGTVAASRLCAACHDLAPLFSGRFDDPAYDPDRDPSSQTGISCVGCHAITAVNSPRGNGDYTLVPPPQYPFGESDSRLLRAINQQLIKAKPAFHQKTLLKPLHRSPEFCSVCHKVHLPFELNHYRWLRGQDHYDSYLLSGVSGHRVDSFYYPPRAIPRCAGCHMPTVASDDPAARDFANTGQRGVHDHQFAAANTAVPAMLGRPDSENDPRRTMLRGVARVDLFGVKEDGQIEGRLHAPLRPRVPTLEPGRRYLLETVVRTLRVGHELTQGTADSNELWLEVEVRSGERLIAKSGGLDPEGALDPWVYFLNAYVLDRHGNRIDRRNAQDIFVALYNHQVPPGAAAVAHFAFQVPPEAREPISVRVRFQYRKFDAPYLRHIEGAAFDGNALPITTLAEDQIHFPVAGGPAPASAAGPTVPEWERWNDYGIALLREGDQGSHKGELRQAAEAFAEVERLGRAEGPLNLARVYYKEGRVQETATALRRAAQATPPATPWTLSWFSALVDRELGDLDAAIAGLEALANTEFQEARSRGFDFGADFRLLNELGRTLFERARQARGADQAEVRRGLLERSRSWLERALVLEPEYAPAHFNLALVYTELGQPQTADRHRALHERYRADDQAIERAVTAHRRHNPAADHAAQPIAIYDLKPVASPDLAPKVAGSPREAVEP